MGDNNIFNPLAANTVVTAFTSYVDANGLPIPYFRQQVQLRANEAITAGQGVGLVAATATVPLSVEVMDVSDAFAAIVCIGVAAEGAAAGDLISIVTDGPVIANIDDTAATALGDVAVKHATTDGAFGDGGTLGGTWDAADVAGTALGIWLGPEIGTSNQAPLWFRKF